MKLLVLVFITFLFYAGNVQAYVGPGIGLGAIGALVGIVLSVLMAIVGIFWYPLKRLFKKNDDDETIDDSESMNSDNTNSSTSEQPPQDTEEK